MAESSSFGHDTANEKTKLVDPKDRYSEYGYGGGPKSMYSEDQNDIELGSINHRDQNGCGPESVNSEDQNCCGPESVNSEDQNCCGPELNISEDQNGAGQKAHCMVCRKSKKIKTFDDLRPGDHIEMPIKKKKMGCTVKLPIKHHAIVKEIIHKPEQGGATHSGRNRPHKDAHKAQVIVIDVHVDSKSEEYIVNSRDLGAKNKDKSQDNDKDMGKDKVQDNDEDKGKGKGKDDDKYNDKDMGQDKDKGKGDDDKDHDKDKDRDGDENKGKDKDENKGKDKDENKGKDKDNDNDRDQDTEMNCKISKIRKVEYRRRRNTHEQTLENAETFVKNHKDIYSKKYNLFMRNCEHFCVAVVNWDTQLEGHENTGNASSLQSARSFWVFFHICLFIFQCFWYGLNFYVYAIYAKGNERYNHFVRNTSSSWMRCCYTKFDYRGVNTICDWMGLGLLLVIYIDAYVCLLYCQRTRGKDVCTQCRISARIVLITKMICFAATEIFNIFLEKELYAWIEWFDKGMTLTIFIIVCLTLLELWLVLFAVPRVVVKCLVERCLKCCECRSACCSQCCSAWCCYPWEFDEDSYKYVIHYA